MKDHYIHAVLEMLESGTDIKKVLSGLSVALAKKGHQKLHGSILRGVLRILAHQTTIKGSRVVVAHEQTLVTKKEAIEQALATLGAPKEYTVIVDPSIIGGTIVEFNNARIDTSYKTRLVKLYRAITN